MKKLLYHNSGGIESIIDGKVNRRAFIRRTSGLLAPMFFSSLFLPRLAKASSSIISRTISAANQNAISMSNSTWARPVTLPGGWNKIRVGCRMHMTNTGADLTSNPIFEMGFCSGTTNQYGDASTTHFLGLSWDAATWSWVTPPAGYFLSGVTLKPRKRVGTTNTTGAAMTSSSVLMNAGAASASADRQLVFFDVTKGSPNYTCAVPWTCFNGTPGADISASNFLLFMGQASPNPGGAYTGGGSTTLAVNEGTDGTFNAINFYWNRTDATLEICDIAVAVLS